MATRGRALTLALLLLMSGMAIAPAQAQVPDLLPGVQVTCQNDQTPVALDISQASALSVQCTVENPTLYVEEIEIEYDGDGLAATGLESASVPAGGDITFDVVITQGGAPDHPDTFNVTVTATVTSVNGISTPDFLAQFNPSDEGNILVEIQPFSQIDIDVSPQYLAMEGGSMPASISVIVRNMGNAEDVYVLTVDDAELVARGFNVSVSPDLGNAPPGESATFTVTLTPPKVLEDEVIEVRLTATSNLRAMSAMEVFNINATAAPESLLDLNAMNIPSWAYIAAGVVAGLVVLAVMISVIKKLSSGASRYLDEDDFADDEDDEDLDLDDLDDLDL